MNPLRFGLVTPIGVADGCRLDVDAAIASGSVIRRLGLASTESGVEAPSDSFALPATIRAARRNKSSQRRKD